MKVLRKIIFHRVTFVAISILAQLLVLAGAIIKFNEYFIFFYVICIIISVLAVFVILYKNTNPAYKIAWIVLISVFPVLGGLLYLFFGFNKLNRRTKKKMQSITSESRQVLMKHEVILDEIKSQSETAANESRYIQNYSLFPPCVNTKVEYFKSGEMTFEKLIDELKKAEHYIFLEYFIIGKGFMWNSILDILIDKVNKGVDVRVIYDDIGCIFTLPKGYNKELEKVGIKCCVFNPLVPLISLKFNNRDHRKIAVIDGAVAFTGGINLADEYINKYEKYGYWKDNSIMIKGDAVWNLTVAFLSMWDFLKGVDEDFYKFKKDFPYDPSIKGYVQPFVDSPLDNEPVGETVYMNLINRSNRYIYMTTPYLIIGNEILSALTSSAKAGVDVRIITPYIPDKKLVNSVTKSYYQTLIEGGVKIYEYLPGFIHSKTYVADDEYSVVGSINMDFRSLYLHFECGVWMYKTPSVLDVKNDFLDTLKKCKQITLEDAKSVKWYTLLWRLVLRVFAPMM
ncbi:MULTISPECIES: cardiolipin synthase [Clostridium]|uniref:cardiolipin synthase n=1 Tax=Clostridium TaxID=1485 RepID=UPI0008261EA5|nr:MULTISPECIES: cardiolipin synthase [Clostridium]PJI08681.1 cardiolipin synthase [Clostridium sp. CT7]